MAVIIDGYNLLHSIHKEDSDSEPMSDVGLCRIVSRYLQLINEKGEIIFDGAGPRDKSRFDNISSLEVFFAGLSRDADTVIEEKIRASTAPRRLTIVSSDRKLRDAGRKRKATVVTSQVFWGNICKQLASKKKTITEPRGKRHGLSDSETKQWLKFFGLEK